ncbi:MAG: hypothetical protein AAF492_13465, partial [Verrucomicrobiota bacterium]
LQLANGEAVAIRFKNVKTVNALLLPSDFMSIWRGFAPLNVPTCGEAMEVLKDAYRDLRSEHGETTDGRHEWIPSNMMGGLMEEVATQAPSLLWKWIHYQDVLRTPVDALILRPTLSRPYYDNREHYQALVQRLNELRRKAHEEWQGMPNPPDFMSFLRGRLEKEGLHQTSVLNFQGHEGALYLLDASKIGRDEEKIPQTRGAKEWHDELCGLAEEGAHAVDRYAGELEAYIQDHFWDGHLPGLDEQLLDAVLCDYFDGPGPGARRIGETLSDFCRIQQTRWSKAMASLRKNLDLLPRRGTGTRSVA